MKSIPRHSNGYTLLEAIVYVAVLTIVINLAAGAFLNQHRLNMAGVKALDRVREMNRLSADVRGLIRQAAAVLDEGAGNTTSEDTLVLALPADDNGARRTAVLTLLDEDGRFGWMVFEHGEVVRAVSYRLAFEEVRVSLDTDDFPEVRRVTLELTPAYAFGEKRAPVPRYVTGALRNRGQP